MTAKTAQKGRGDVNKATQSKAKAKAINHKAKAADSKVKARAI